MIRKITMSNIKGQNSEQQLTGKDIIIGPNGAGKTTRMQSIGLAVLGYVPGKGKTLADTFELASDSTMAVGIEADGFTFRREFKKSSKLDKNGGIDVKIGQNITVSPSQGESSNKQKEARISAEMGDFPAMLDFGAFIGLTDNKKRDFIYNLNSSGFTWDCERIRDHIEEELLTTALMSTNPEMYEVMRDNIISTMEQYRDGAEVQEGLLAMMVHAKDRLSFWKKEKIKADGAAQKLTEYKNKAKDTDRDLAINRDKLKEAQEERERIIQELAQAAAHNATIETKEKELKQLQAEIEAMEDTSGDGERLDELKELVQLHIEAISGNEKEADEEAKKIAEIKKRYDDAIKLRDTAQDEKNDMTARIKELNATIKAKSEMIEKIIDHKGFCAFNREIPCVHDFSGFIATEQSYIDSLYESVDILRDGLKDAENKIAEQKERVIDLSHALHQSEVTRDEFLSEIERNKKDLDISRESIHNIENKAPALTTKREQAAQTKAYIDENPRIDLTDMEEQKTALNQKIEALTATIDEQKKIRNDIINIRSNIIDSQTAAYEVECWKQIVEAIGQKGIQGEIVKEMLDPIRGDIDKKLADIGLDKKFFFETESDTGKEIFRFGWTDHGDRRSFDALSQGEQLLLMIALMTTIIEKSDPPVKILAIDNINDLDAKNMSKVIRGLNAAGNTMDNIILSGVATPYEEDTEGWTVWSLEENDA